MSLRWRRGTTSIFRTAQFVGVLEHREHGAHQPGRSAPLGDRVSTREGLAAALGLPAGGLDHPKGPKRSKLESSGARFPCLTAIRNQ